MKHKTSQNHSLSALTHWGRVTHICISKIIMIGSDNGLLSGRRQAIIWTNAGILLGTNFNEILSEILTFSFKKIRLNVLSAKWQPFCLGLNVLNLIMEHFLAYDRQQYDNLSILICPCTMTSISKAIWCRILISGITIGSVQLALRPEIGIKVSWYILYYHVNFFIWCITLYHWYMIPITTIWHRTVNLSNDNWSSRRPVEYYSSSSERNGCFHENVLGDIVHKVATFFVQEEWVNTLRPRQYGGHFADDIFKCILLNEIFEFSWKFHWCLFLRVQLTIFQHCFR